PPASPLFPYTTLFRSGRATANVSIRPAANRFKELLGNSRDAMVRPEAWEQVEKDLAEAKARKQTLDGEIGALERDLAWISRCERSEEHTSELQSRVDL